MKFSDEEKTVGGGYDPSSSTSLDSMSHSSDAQGEVKRELKSRHISMIALGGTIGTGLFIGTKQALGNAGPAGALIG